MEEPVKMSNAPVASDSNGKSDGHQNGVNAEQRDNNKCTSNGSTQLAETFYVTSKKNTVYYVKLSEKGLTLRKETNISAKEQTIRLQDIIGCRCLRSKRRKRNVASCTCTALTGPAELKVVDENSQDLDETDVSVYLYIYAYILEKSDRSTNGRRERTTITLRFRSFDNYEQNNDEAQKWRSAIKHLISEYADAASDNQYDAPIITTKALAQPVLPAQRYVPHDMRKILVLLNPKSGSGKARETFQKCVASVFNEAEVPYDLQITKYANYAREYVRNRDIYGWRSIVVVGGDGIFFEVLNGLFEREDWERAITTVPIGIVPCGSGNGLARTIAYVFGEPYEPKPVLNAALTVVRGHTASMDMVRVETKSQIMFSFLSIGWGFISDIDIESERLRAIGYQRFAIWSVHRLINLRTYSGKLSYLKAKHAEGSDKNATLQRYVKSNAIKHSMSCNIGLAEHSKCQEVDECDVCDAAFEDVLELETNGETENNNANNLFAHRQRLDSWHSANSRKSAYYSTNESVYRSVADQLSTTDSDPDATGRQSIQMYGPASTIPALTAPVPNDWIIETGEFVMVHAAYQTHIGSDCLFAPKSQLDDGIIWLMVIRAGATRQELFKFLIGLSSGTHIPTAPNPYMEMIPVTAFRIEPNGSQGHFTVDGELIEYGPIQCEIFNGLSKVLVPKPL